MYLKTVGISGLLSAIKGKVTKEITFFEIQREDCRYPFKLRVPSSDVATYLQVFEEEEYHFCATNSPDIIIDAGANIGLASIYFTNKYPNAKIIAIEPETGNFSLLKENIAPYPNIIALQAALWHKNEQIDLIDPGYGNWGFQTVKHHANSNQKYQSVQALTVDKILQKFNLPHIDLLKIDVEGAEKEIFSDAKSWIKKVNALIIELHESQKAGCEESFYQGTKGVFDSLWEQGENVFLSKNHYIRRCSRQKKTPLPNSSTLGALV